MGQDIEFNFSLNGLTGFDLHGKTVGVAGTGKIGRIFIDICRGFGMHVIAYDLFPAKDSDIEYVTLDELFRRSDIISLHCPLTEKTRHLVDADAISKMKKGVVLLNTSRGALIDAEALLEGIKERKTRAVPFYLGKGFEERPCDWDEPGMFKMIRKTDGYGKEDTIKLKSNKDESKNKAIESRFSLRIGNKRHIIYLYYKVLGVG